MAASEQRPALGTVLIADDEPSFVEALVLGLQREGFATIVASDGEQALELSRARDPDLVLLDVMLPRMSGLDVCRTLRQESQVPIIMVTARSGELDTVLGLELGADDYVSKPFRMSELIARIRALMRRSRATAAPNPKEEVLSAHGITVYVDRHQVLVRGDEVKLPPKEFDLLTLFLRNPGRVLTRDLIIDRVWGADYYGDTKTLDVHIKRLRTKIEPDPNAPSVITTVRGVGYRLELDHA
jgi:two-component system response regulator RegX3